MPRAIAIVAVTLAGLAAPVSSWADNATPPNATQPNAPPPSAPPATAVQSIAPDAAEAILGRPVVDRTGKEIARLVDVLVDRNGAPQAAVVDFGGFLGVGARKIAVHWSVLRFTPGDGKHLITLDMTPDEIKAAPSYSSPDKPASVVIPAAPPPANTPDSPVTVAAPASEEADTKAPEPAPAPAEDTPAGHENDKPGAAAQTR
jgi:hypothetical protein